MKNVKLTMRDTKTGEIVTREICGLNAYSSGSETWELRGKNEQRKNLIRWIIERGNEQHDTILELIDFHFVEDKQEPKKGLLVDVYRDANGYDCTNRGQSSKFDRFILIGEGIPEIFTPGPETPVLKLVKRELFGGDYLHVEPTDKPENTPGAMFGGNFVYTSDSRFPSKQPLPIHDRFE